MRRLASGGVAGAILLVVAARAEAQVGNVPTDPIAVSVYATSSVFKATVTCGATFKYYLKVYHNEVGPKHTSTSWIMNPPPVYYFAKTVIHTGWNMAVGDVLRYNGKAQKVSTGETAEANWYVTVSDPGTYRTPDRDRKEWDKDSLWA